MAIDPSSPSKSNLSIIAKKDNKIKSPESKNGDEIGVTKGVSKRKGNPGIRVVGGRIYGSENGKTCHQCRQKTTDFVAVCKSQRNNKTCPIAYCHKCLLNRYGEKAEEVSKLEDWSCPKCKGICNCSLCMKKRGHQPTGTLAHTAKANGFSSVSDMLQNNGPTISNHEKLVTGTGASPIKQVTHEVDNGIIVPTNLGKENSFTGEVDSNLLPVSPLDHVTEKANKAKLKGSGKRHYDDGASEAEVNTKVKRRMLEGKGKKDTRSPSLEPVGISDDKKPKKSKQDKVNGMKDDILLRRTSPRKHTLSTETLKINGTGGAKANSRSEMKIVEGQESKPIDRQKQNPNPKKQKNLKKDKLNHIHNDALAKRTSPRKLKQLNETVDVNPVLHSPSRGTLKINETSGATANALFERKNLEGQESKPIDYPKQKPDQKKQKILKQGTLNHMYDGTLAKRTSPRKHNTCQPSKETVETSSLCPIKTEKIKKICDHGNQSKASRESSQINKMYQKVHCDKIDDDIKLPQGSELMSIDASDIPPEDIGKALQFLEFCAVFGKILDVKKGQPESVLKDLLHGRTSRRGKYSATVQFHIHLISIIQEEQEMFVDINSSNGKHMWVQALKECFSESESVLRLLALDHSLKSADAYENLKSSEKLLILNVLCDEILGTAKIRNWIDDQIMKHSERAKEQREKVADARNKEKSLKQKVQNDIAKAIIEKKSSSLSISEHEAIISQIKSEAAQAHSELLESEGHLTKTSQAPDALRIEPEYVGTNGRVYWRLKSFSNKSDIVMQDIGSNNIFTCNEKWYSFDEEQKESIQKSIIVLRTNKLRAQNFRKRHRNHNKELAPKPLDM